MLPLYDDAVLDVYETLVRERLHKKSGTLFGVYNPVNKVLAFSQKDRVLLKTDTKLRTETIILLGRASKQYMLDMEIFYGYRMPLTALPKTYLHVRCDPICGLMIDYIDDVSWAVPDDRELNINDHIESEDKTND